jgi:hypothetical protein
MNLREALGYLDQLKDLRRFIAANPRLQQTYRRISADQIQQEPLTRG